MRPEFVGVMPPFFRAMPTQNHRSGSFFLIYPSAALVWARVGSYFVIGSGGILPATGSPRCYVYRDGWYAAAARLVPPKLLPLRHLHGRKEILLFYL